MLFNDPLPLLPPSPLYLIAGGIAVGDAEVIVLRLDIDVRQDELLLDVGPDDARHLVTVHLHHAASHLDAAAARVCA